MITSKDCYMKKQCGKYLSGRCSCDSVDEYCPKLFRIDTLYSEAMLTEPQRKYIKLKVPETDIDFPVYTELEKIRACMDTTVNSGYSFYLFSNTGCGNGKTAWAIQLLQSYINKIWHKSDVSCRALFINVPKLLIELKNFDNRSEELKHILQHIETADIVVWDEIGNKLGTQFEIDRLLSFINARVEAHKTNIYTSNLSPEQLRQCLGERLYSRIINLSVVLEFRGADKRSPVFNN